MMMIMAVVRMIKTFIQRIKEMMIMDIVMENLAKKKIKRQTKDGIYKTKR